MTGKKSDRKTFVRGNERLDKLLARPDIAAGVAEVEAEAREMDRVYAENLAMIRRASDLTQVEVAEKLGVGQAVVSRLERRSDMLLSTLADYLHATGAEHPRIVVILNGMEVELDLDQFRESRPA
jgi:DNA-binding transcriptional regulator YiaG